MTTTKMVKWFTDHTGKVTYSMQKRPYTYENSKTNKYQDCSSSVYSALIYAGYLKENHPLGNTDSLYNDLKAIGWKTVTGNFKKGDVFIWGKLGASGGSAGHTGVFISGATVVSTNYMTQGAEGTAIQKDNWTKYKARATSAKAGCVVLRAPGDVKEAEKAEDKPKEPSTPVKPSDKLAVDGVLGKLTITALQLWVAVKTDGVLGSMTVRALQRKIGGVVIDGIWGKQTTKGLQAYLNRAGYKLAVDGIRGVLTVKALQDYLNKVVK